MTPGSRRVDHRRRRSRASVWPATLRARCCPTGALSILEAPPGLGRTLGPVPLPGGARTRHAQPYHRGTAWRSFRDPRRRVAPIRAHQATRSAKAGIDSAIQHTAVVRGRARNRRRLQQRPQSPQQARLGGVGDAAAVEDLQLPLPRCLWPPATSTTTGLTARAAGIERFAGPGGIRVGPNSTMRASACVVGSGATVVAFVSGWSVGGT